MPESPTGLPGADANPWVAGINSLVKGLPWSRLTLHMVPVIIIILVLGHWLMGLYTINVQKGLVGAFPTSQYLQFYTNIVIGILVINTGLDALDFFFPVNKQGSRWKKKKSN